MAQLPSILVVASCLIVLVLGSAHLFFTYSGNKFHPRDPEVTLKMQETSPRISSETTIWDAGIGFHASHSLGAILFSLVYLGLVLGDSPLLFRSLYLQIVGLAYLCTMTVLAKRYWFRIPFVGIGAATVLYGVALATHRVIT